MINMISCDLVVYEYVGAVFYIIDSLLKNSISRNSGENNALCDDNIISINGPHIAVTTSYPRIVDTLQLF